MNLRDLTKIVVRPWTDLRGISNSSAAKSTILIPLVGYWIVFNESAVHWLQLAHQLGGSDPMDRISPRLLWLYMALCAIAAGTFIYALRCPPEVKKYGDYKDYVNGDGPAMTMLTLKEIEESLEREGYYELGPTHKNDMLDVYFSHLNLLHPASRLVVTILFFFGFTILTVLSAQVFIRVFRLMIGL
jgi:hypothetical protein